MPAPKKQNPTPKNSQRKKGAGMSVAGLNPDDFRTIPTEAFGKSLRGAVKRKK